MSAAEASRTVIRMMLFVPGDSALRGAGVPGEWHANPRNGSFTRAFSLGTIEPPLLERIEAAPGALLVPLSEDLRTGREDVLAAVETLHQRGALAVRLEQSGLGWDIDQWLALVRPGDPVALYRCAVALLVGDTHVVSCGMHAFSLPDASAPLAALTSEEAQELVSTLNVYQIDEDPLLLSGQIFSVGADAPRYVVQRWPDDGYPANDWCHNPYGVWRLSQEGDPPRPQTEFHPLFVPPLVDVLQAIEDKSGPATRGQVEETVRRGTCMAVEHGEARALERARGYVDIDPQLAWEQWCVVRARRGAVGP